MCMRELRKAKNMCGKKVIRGFVVEDERDFYREESLLKLKQAQKELLYLLENNYPIKSASTFVGNHHRLSERQRLALVRATASKEVIRNRLSKEMSKYARGKTVYIDGLNVIITLEVALSGSTLFTCMDQTIRDLAGLRGTYRLIDKTKPAIHLIREELENLGVGQAYFYLDAPVSNTGRLKACIYEVMEGASFQTQVELVDNADVILEKKDNVITSDAIILNKCISWVNLVPAIIHKKIKDTKVINLGSCN